MKDLQIRLVLPEDKENYVTMRYALWPSLPLEEHAKDFDALQAGDRTCQRYGVVALARNNQGAGFMDFSIRSYVDGSTKQPVAHLEGIWVKEEYQRRGIGKALVTFFEKWAAENGFVEISSDADIENVISHHAHEKWGFSEVDRIVIFRKPLK